MDEHNREKYFYEILAGLVLKVFFPAEYSKLHHSDKPDLIDERSCVGVEVCRTIDPYEEEKYSYWNKKLKKRPVSTVKDELTKYLDSEYDVIIRDVDGVPTIVGMSPPAKWETNDCLLNTIKKKAEKIQKGQYTEVSVLDLYIYSDAFEEREKQEIQTIFADTVNILCDSRIRYLFIDEFGWLYRCTVENGEIIYIDTKKVYKELQMEAKKLAGY